MIAFEQRQTLAVELLPLHLLVNAVIGRRRIEIPGRATKGFQRSPAESTPAGGSCLNHEVVGATMQPHIASSSFFNCADLRPRWFEGHVMETIFLVPGIAGSRLGLNNLGLNNQEVGLPHPRRCGLATLDHHREADYGLGPF